MSKIITTTETTETFQKECEYCGREYAMEIITIAIDGVQQGTPQENWVNHWRTNCKQQQEKKKLKAELNYTENRNIEACQDCIHSDYEDGETYCHFKNANIFEVDPLGIYDKYEQ